MRTLQRDGKLPAAGSSASAALCRSPTRASTDPACPPSRLSGCSDVREDAGGGGAPPRRSPCRVVVGAPRCLSPVHLPSLSYVNPSPSLPHPPFPPLTHVRTLSACLRTSPTSPATTATAFHSYTAPSSCLPSLTPQRVHGRHGPHPSFTVLAPHRNARHRLLASVLLACRPSPSRALVPPTSPPNPPSPNPLFSSPSRRVATVRRCPSP